MRKALAAFFWTGLFLLMLSALVVSPEQTAAADVSPPSPAHFHAVVLPIAPADEAHEAAAQQRAADWRMLTVLISLVLWQIAARSLLHDSNGRVLTSVRYENSVYQVFRAEVAGG